MSLASELNGPVYGPRKPSANLLHAFQHTRRPNNAYYYAGSQPSLPTSQYAPAPLSPRPSRASLAGISAAPVTIGAVHGGKTKKHRRNKKSTRKNKRKTRYRK